MQVVTILLPVIFAFVLMSVKLFNSYRRAVRDHLLDRFYSSEPCHELKRQRAKRGCTHVPQKETPPSGSGGAVPLLEFPIALRRHAEFI
jgi:hypothetical protein